MTYKFKYGNKEIKVPQMKDITWANVLSKPTTFTPSSHTHQMSQISDWQTYVYNATASRDSNTVLAAPSGSQGKASFRKLTASDLPSHTHSYVPLSGGTITGNLNFRNTNTRIYGENYNGTDNIYVYSKSGYLALYSYEKAIYANMSYYDSNWTSGKFYPSHTGCALGSSTASNRWYRLYAANACNTSSDRRLKDNIVYFDEMPVTFIENSETVLEKFFKSLKPSTFTMKDDKYKRMKFGFIAQDVIQSLDDIGMSIYDVDFVSHGRTEDEKISEDAMYGLCYEEFVALNTHMIQKAYKIIENNQREIESLRKEMSELKSLIFNNQKNIE